MQHVVTQPHPPFRTSDAALEVHQVPAWQDNLVWVLVCTRTGDGAVVDGPAANQVLRYCADQGIRLTAVFNTHTHGDHIGVNHELARRGLLDGMRVVGCRDRAGEIPGLSEPVDEGDEVWLGKARGRVLRTEGHIDDHVSFVFGDAAFCGDTLFAGGCGYLFDGPPEKMYHSLHKLAALDPATRVCCAHEYTQDNLRFAWSVEPENAALAARIRRVWAQRARGESAVPSSIGEERQTNPFLRSDSADLVRHVREAWPDRVLDDAPAVFAATRALKDRKAYRALSEADLPL